MSNKSYFQEAKDNARENWRGFIKFLDEYDAEGWPAFGVFFAVVTLGMFMAFQGFRGVVGDFPAALISLFFEAAILAWKMTTNRKRNDAHQNDISNWATWLSVITAVAMLVVNLFRVGGSQGFESIAYIIVGIAASVQVVAYLLFTQADPDKQMAREHSQAGRELSRKQIKAKNVIGELESDVGIIRYIVQELQRIADESIDLPIAQREYLLEAARKKLLAQYAEGKDDIARATRGLADLNKDGHIGMESSKSVFKTHELGNARDLEKLKELPVDVLFDEPLAEEKPTELPTVANDSMEPKETSKPDF